MGKEMRESDVQLLILIVPDLAPRSDAGVFCGVLQSSDTPGDMRNVDLGRELNASR
jgi:hypothetical protein